MTKQCNAWKDLLSFFQGMRVNYSADTVLLPDLDNDEKPVREAAKAHAQREKESDREGSATEPSDWMRFRQPSRWQRTASLG